MKNSQRTKVSVIIPTRLGQRRLVTLDSLKGIDGIEIIIEHDQKGLDISRTRNRGARKAIGDKLVFMDDDISFTKDFFEKFVNAIKPNTMVGLSLGNERWVASRAMGFMKDDFWRLGGFFERFGYRGMDVELSFRAQELGIKIVSFPVNSVIHYINPATESTLKKTLLQDSHCMFVDLRYHVRPISDWFKRKHLIRIALRFLFLMYWLIYLKVAHNR